MKLVIAVVLALVGCSVAAPHIHQSKRVFQLVLNLCGYFKRSTFNHIFFLIILTLEHAQIQGNLRPALDQLLENVDREGLIALLPSLEQTEEGQRVLEFLRGEQFARIVEVLYAEAEFNNVRCILY